MINIILDGKKVQAVAGKTILEVAQENGIEIPTLCHDKELNPYGSCWVCAVKVTGRKGFVTSCGTQITEGMEVFTSSEEVRRARKMALELLLSDHYADCDAPCMIACPDKVDIQAYVAAIANNQYHEAVRIIKDKLPMPLSIGRVCPAFCEKECRRSLVEDPIAIRQLKRYAADRDLEDFWQWVPQKEESKGKKIAIIGAGPSGLTCGYYLSYQGYEVDIFEEAPQAGGWLRYGIPEYRLPKNILDKEIELMCSAGMKIHTNKKLGINLYLEKLTQDYDAVYLAIGAQKAVDMPLKGSSLKGVYLGVDYLKNFALGKTPETGKKTAVIGGGNTAVDCARTALRLGSEVTIIYRRTRQEMPAEDFEITAAEEEGVKFMMLTNPVEYRGNDSLQQIVLEIMKLEEPDSSGRRRPVGTGEYEAHDFDTVIAAISQIPDVQFLTEDENKINHEILPLTKWSTAQADEETMFTGIANIFAGGDFRRGPATAIEAIADGRIAAENIDKFLNKQPLKKKDFNFDSKKEKLLKQIDPETYAQYEKIQRVHATELNPQERGSNFKEVEYSYSDNEAFSEASRCLECGCNVNESCFLRKYATNYEVSIEALTGDRNIHPIDDTHPFIRRDENKCIKCGRCVRTCSEIQGAGVLGYIYRGFDTTVAPEFGESLNNTSCEACGKCITVCPVGALTPKHLYKKSTPLSGEVIYQNCGLCGTACKIQTDICNSAVREISEPKEDKELSFNDRNLCFYGRFGWQVLEDKNRIITPQIKVNNEWRPASVKEIKDIVTQKLLTFEQRYAFISAESSLEEMYLFKHIEKNKRFNILNAMSDYDISDEIYDSEFDCVKPEDLKKAEAIVIFGKVSQTVRTLCRLAQRENKVKLILVKPTESGYNNFADMIINDNIFISLNEHCTNKTIFIYNKNESSIQEIKEIWTLASDLCDFKEGSGVLACSNLANSRGLNLMNIPKYDNHKISNSLIIAYKHKLNFISNKDNFIIAIDCSFEADMNADMFIPTASYLEIEAHTLSDFKQLSRFENPKNSNLFYLLLNICYETDLIPPTQAEPSLWNMKVEEFLNNLTPNHLTKEKLQQIITNIDVNRNYTNTSSRQKDLMNRIKPIKK